MADQDTTVEVMQAVREGPVATLWLNRPERLNALNTALIEAAAHQLATWEADPGVRVVLLRGRGRAFCAGDDLSGMGDPEVRAVMDFTLRREQGYERLFKVIYDLRKPVIAVLHGHAVGAGAMIALASDVRIAASDAHIGFPFVQRGITGGTALVARYVGFGKAHELLLTGDPVTGEEAERIGLVTQAVASGRPRCCGGELGGALRDRTDEGAGVPEVPTAPRDEPVRGHRVRAELVRRAAVPHGEGFRGRSTRLQGEASPRVQGQLTAHA